MKFGLETLLHLGLQARIESRFQDARLVLIVLILNQLRQLTVYIMRSQQKRQNFL